MSKIQNLVEKINEYSHLKALKMAIVQLLPLFIAVSFILIFNHYFNIPFLKLLISLFFQAYPILLAGAYGYHYAIEKQQSPITIISFDIILMIIINTNMILSNRATWQVTLPVILLTFIFNEGLCFLDRLPKFRSVFPQAVNDYLYQITILLIAFILLGGMVIIAQLILPYLVTIFDFLMTAINSIYGILIVVLITVLFWVMGMHGVAFIGTILRPFWLQMMIINSIQFLNGTKPSFIGTEAFYQWFIWIGGSGATLGLVILMRYFAKSQQLKSLGKEALLSGFVNINEQVIFGTPIVMNKKIMIPFIITPCLFAFISYYAITIGFVQAPVILAPWIFPFLLGSFMSVGGMYQAIILTLGLVVLSIIIYLPFFIDYDLQLKKCESIKENV